MTKFNEPTSTEIYETATAPEVVARLLASLRAPLHPLEGLRFTTMADDLARLDGAAAAALINLPHDRSGGAYGQLPCYVLGTLAVDGIAKEGLLLRDADDLLRVIRHQIRFELVRLPAQVPAVWLVPSNPEEQTSAHVASLLLMSRGVIAKPWLWSGIPEHGRFHLIGSSAVEHPASEGPRCEGSLDLIQLIRQSSEFSTTASDDTEKLCG